MSRGQTLYTGPGGFAPATFLTSHGIACPEGYNVADFLLEVASDPPASLVRASSAGSARTATSTPDTPNGKMSAAATQDDIEMGALEKGDATGVTVKQKNEGGRLKRWLKTDYKTTFLTQLQVLSGREWKVLRRCVVCETRV